jgi:hypothetical protein
MYRDVSLMYRDVLMYSLMYNGTRMATGLPQAIHQYISDTSRYI